ncbi:isocitrate dehydrogenase [NADP] [Tanacetum coccineum]
MIPFRCVVVVIFEGCIRWYQELKSMRIALLPEVYSPTTAIDIKYYDLGLLNCDATDDKVTVERVEATLKYAYVLLLQHLCLALRIHILAVVDV